MTGSTTTIFNTPTTLAQIINLPHNFVPPKPADAYDVVIVGAGVAGLAAAVNLIQNNMTVLLLEARDRVGGRISTDTSNGYVAEMGAMFLPADSTSESNPLSALFTSQDTSIAALTKMLSYDAGGNFFQSDTLKEAEAVIEKLITDSLASSNPNKDGSDLTVEEMVTYVLNGTELTALETCILTSFVETQFGASPDELSWSGFKSRAENNDGSLANFANSGSRISPSGLSTVISNAVSSKLATAVQIRTGVEVNYINYEKEQYLKGDSYVQTNWTSGSKSGGAISKYVLVTVPLGVLKANAIHFVPPIPGYYKAAITQMGYAHMEHIYLKFPTNSLLFLSSLDVLIKVPTDYKHLGPDDGFVMTISLKHLEGEDVLFTPVGGPVADMIEAAGANSTEIIDLIMAQLLLIKPDLPQPVSWKISSWKSDPYSLGAMSYLKLGASVDTIKQLGKPYKNRLFWAGEHTSQKHWGTIRGAYESGVAAAKTIASVKHPNVPVKSS